MKLKSVGAIAGALVLAVCLGTAVSGQAGKGLVDFNTAAEKDLLTLPGVTPSIVKGIIDQRPFVSIVDVHKYLLGQSLTAEQATAIYEKAFVQLNLNTCTREEILLVPRARQMAREFPEYRPWKNWAQFDKEIGKYVAQVPGELDRLRMYVFIPMNPNTAMDADLMTIPALTPAVLKALKDHRPWTSKEQFVQEMSKVTSAKEAERIWRYLAL